MDVDLLGLPILRIRRFHFSVGAIPCHPLCAAATTHLPSISHTAQCLTRCSTRMKSSRRVVGWLFVQQASLINASMASYQPAGGIQCLSHALNLKSSLQCESCSESCSCGYPWCCHATSSYMHLQRTTTSEHCMSKAGSSVTMASTLQIGTCKASQWPRPCAVRPDNLENIFAARCK